ncbi:MAG TPA: MarR family transcriptional regulator [Acidimicrobiia bacterium]|nr:MarR family transcriptional regulator [Acidimicrobiia bacterium]
MDPNPVLSDERLTTAGLFFEAAAGLQGTLEKRLNAEVGLSVQWFEVLMRLARSPDQRLRMCDLAAQVSMSPSGLTRAVDRLVDAGFVTREHCPTDRRVAWAQLTPAGLARVEEAVPVHLAHLDEHLMAPLDEQQRAQLEALLRLVRDHVNPQATQLSPDGAH